MEEVLIAFLALGGAASLVLFWTVPLMTVIQDVYEIISSEYYGWQERRREAKARKEIKVAYDKVIDRHGNTIKNLSDVPIYLTSTETVSGDKACDAVPARFSSGVKYTTTQPGNYEVSYYNSAGGEYGKSMFNLPKGYEIDISKLAPPTLPFADPDSKFEIKKPKKSKKIKGKKYEVVHTTRLVASGHQELTKKEIFDSVRDCLRQSNGMSFDVLEEEIENAWLVWTNPKEQATSIYTVEFRRAYEPRYFAVKPSRLIVARAHSLDELDKKLADRGLSLSNYKISLVKKDLK